MAVAGSGCVTLSQVLLSTRERAVGVYLSPAPSLTLEIRSGRALVHVRRFCIAAQSRSGFLVSVGSPDTSARLCICSWAA